LSWIIVVVGIIRFGIFPCLNGIFIVFLRIIEILFSIHEPLISIVHIPLGLVNSLSGKEVLVISECVSLVELSLPEFIIGFIPVCICIFIVFFSPFKILLCHFISSISHLV